MKPLTEKDLEALASSSERAREAIDRWRDSKTAKPAEPTESKPSSPQTEPVTEPTGTHPITPIYSPDPVDRTESKFFQGDIADTVVGGTTVGAGGCALLLLGFKALFILFILIALLIEMAN